MKGNRGWRLSMAMLAVVLMTILAATAAAAQAIPNEVQSSAPIDLAMTYDALHANHITGQNFWMQGGALEIGARLYHGLGVAARVEGVHANAQTTTGEPLSLLTAVAGPRYTMQLRNQRYAIFAEGMAGESDGLHSLFSMGSGPVGSPNVGIISSPRVLAIDAGGGVDMRLNPHFALRLVRASYLRTQFPNTTTNVQNSLSLSSGVAIMFGK